MRICRVEKQGGYEGGRSWADADMQGGYAGLICRADMQGGYAGRKV